ncbi:Uncharacterized protein FWK35_00036570 [Aphis craccivora]|uniref:Uncharacterized protein n=1 Tax=Aphis craccivora TaxID=307492 RepID=A0A6G0WI62_APHCR|nr:Uncharacterized protein FWK35_00036570 [Aphis craccivora]
MLSGEWRIRKNDELETLFHKPSILETIKNKRLLWAGHAWRSQNPYVWYWRKTLMEKDRWEDHVGDGRTELGMM